MFRSDQPALGDVCRWCGDPATTAVRVTPKLHVRACASCDARLKRSPGKTLQPQYEQAGMLPDEVGRTPQPVGPWWAL